MQQVRSAVRACCRPAWGVAPAALPGWPRDAVAAANSHSAVHEVPLPNHGQAPTGRTLKSSSSLVATARRSMRSRRPPSHSAAAACLLLVRLTTSAVSSGTARRSCKRQRQRAAYIAASAVGLSTPCGWHVRRQASAAHTGMHASHHAKYPPPPAILAAPTCARMRMSASGATASAYTNMCRALSSTDRWYSRPRATGATAGASTSDRAWRRGRGARQPAACAAGAASMQAAGKAASAAPLP
jgi:hypothetical protein